MRACGVMRDIVGVMRELVIPDVGTHPRTHDVGREVLGLDFRGIEK